MTSAIAARLEAWGRDERADGVPLVHRSFFRDAGPDRAPVLLLHGAGGTPADFGALSRELASLGIATFCPLLPAHGRGESALAGVRFGALAERARDAFDGLADGRRGVAVVGQSVGAILAIHVALERPVSRLAALAPALRPFVVRRLLALPLLALTSPHRAAGTWRWQRDVQRGIAAVSRRLSEVRCPLLVLHSLEDPSVSVQGARDLVARAGSSEKKLVVLDGQGHVLSAAPDSARVFGPLKEFLAA